jgi:hypothetical protein
MADRIVVKLYRLKKQTVHFEPLSRNMLALETDGDPHIVERS